MPFSIKNASAVKSRPMYILSYTGHAHFKCTKDKSSSKVGIYIEESNNITKERLIFVSDEHAYQEQMR